VTDDGITFTMRMWPDEIRTTRTVEEILNGSALEWANLDEDALRAEHEVLRRALETARAQLALWAPIVATAHRDDCMGCTRCT
jgi:hypothetical protein